jgi:hypothetical protein
LLTGGKNKLLAWIKASDFGQVKLDEVIQECDDAINTSNEAINALMKPSSFIPIVSLPRMANALLLFSKPLPSFR